MLPFRDDFTPECIDEAELTLVNKPEDLPQNVQQLVGDMFHRQFHERHRKRKLIREWKLVDRYMQTALQGLDFLTDVKYFDVFITFSDFVLFLRPKTSYNDVNHIFNFNHQLLQI